MAHCSNANTGYLYYRYKAYDSHPYKSTYKLLPSAKQDTVEQQMNSLTLEQFKHFLIASVVVMRRWWARCT